MASQKRKKKSSKRKVKKIHIPLIAQLIKHPRMELVRARNRFQAAITKQVDKGIR
jgi:hypothetical protein